LDDHIDAADTVPTHLKALLRIPQCRINFENRLRAVCDTVEAGEDSMFRMSLEKLGKELLSKATRMVERGLPASMEERFITRALQAPVVLVKCEEPVLVDLAMDIVQAADSQSTSGPSQDSRAAIESQSSVATSVTTVSCTTEMTVIEDVPDALATPEAVPRLLRIKTALNFMLRSYISSTLHSGIQEAITNSKSIDFAPLDTHAKHLEKLRAEANALRTISDNISRKRPLDDDEANEARAEKKRKKEEEEKRKRTESRSIKGLRKVDTSGMQKLSSFFTKAPPKKEMKS
jgi:Ydr279p family RNase H2 complex subunit